MLKKFFKHVLPAMMAFAFSGLYTIVDGFFIGRNIGDTGLAAVNIAFPLAALIQAMGTGIGMGGAVQISVCRGKGEKEQEHQYLGNTLSLLLLVSLGTIPVLFIACRPALVLLGAGGTVLNSSLEYIRILILGTIFQLCATGFAPILRNYGGSLLAMAAMIAGFVTNIILDWLFVAVFQYGMAGAAWATVIGQAVTVIPCLFFLVGKVRSLGKDIYKLTRQTVSHIIRIGISPFGLAMSPNIVVMMMNKTTVIYGGDTAVATYAVISYVVAIIQLLLQGIGDGSQPLTSYYLGLQELKNAKTIRNLSYGFSALIALGSTLLVLLLRNIIPDFFGASGNTAPMIAKSLPIFTIGFVFIAFCRTTTSYFYATKKNIFSYIMVYGEPLILGVILSFVFPRLWNLDGVWVSVPFTQMLLFIVALLLLRKEKTDELYSHTLHCNISCKAGE